MEIKTTMPYVIQFSWHLKLFRIYQLELRLRLAKTGRGTPRPHRFPKLLQRSISCYDQIRAVK